MTQNLNNRLVKGLGANSLGQIITAIIQVVSVPLFLKFWGIELYGEWLILSAIPAYFAMSDIGFGSVAANEMTMLVAREDKSTALEVFQSSWLFISGISLLIALVVLANIWFVPVERWFKISHLNHIEVCGVVLFLTVHVLVGLQGGLLQAGFRCEGRYALGVFWGNVLRFVEFGIVTLAVYLGARPLIASFIFLSIRCIGTIGLRLSLRKQSPWIVYGFRHARIATVKRLAIPAIAFMGFPFGNAMSIQGMRMIISAVLGPPAVVIFSTLRTLTRFALQVMGMINNTVWPEISMAYGANDMELARKLHRYSCQASLWLSLCAVAVLFATGKWIVHIWTQGKIIMDANLFYLLLAVIVANSLWYTSSVVLAAINKHQHMALYYATGTSLSLMLAWVLIPTLGLNGAALALLSIDMFMSFYVVKNSLALLNDEFSEFLKVVIRPPLVHRLMRFRS